MDALNIRVLNNLSGGSGDALAQRVRYINSTPYAKRFTVFANGLNQFRSVAPGYGRQAAAQLEADVKNGAIGFKIFKETGMDTTKADGSRLKIGMISELAPIWETAARLNIPVIIHTAEPQEFFKPLDTRNERWLELALFANRRRYLVPVSFETLSAERDDLFARHPKTRFISAHFGWHANDLGHAAKLLDAYPNVVLELAAILYDLGRQPRSRRFLRQISGSDSVRQGHLRARPNFRTTGACSKRATNTSTTTATTTRSGRWYGMGLPDAVLREGGPPERAAGDPDCRPPEIGIRTWD